MKTLFSFTFLILSIVISSQNRVAKFNGNNYITLGSDRTIKPTEALSLEFFAYYDDWNSIHYSPTLAGNTQHTGFAIAFIHAQIGGWVGYQDTMHKLAYPSLHLSSGWHHFALTSDGQTSKLYLDAEVLTSITNPKIQRLTQPDSSISFMIGAETRYDGKPHEDPGYFFDGYIDELKIWSVCLTQNEIYLSSIGKNRFSLQDSNLCCYYDFNEFFEDSIVKDLSIYKGMGIEKRGVLLIEEDLPYMKARAPIFFINNINGIGHFLYLGFMILLVFILLFYTIKSKKWLLLFLIAHIFFSYLLVLFGYELLYTDVFTNEKALLNINQVHCIYGVSVSLLTTFLFKLKPIPVSEERTAIRLETLFALIPAVLGLWAWSTSSDNARFFSCFISLYFMTLLLFMNFVKVNSKENIFFIVGSIGIIISIVLYQLSYWDIIGNRIKTPGSSILGNFIELFAFVWILWKVDYSLDDSFNEEVDAISGLSLLSEREKEVCNLIVSGLKNKEIADKLFISNNTVKSHIKNIYSKMEVRNRVELTNLIQN